MLFLIMTINEDLLWFLAHLNVSKVDDLGQLGLFHNILS